MNHARAPETVSHDALLCALELTSLEQEFPGETGSSVYRMQLRQSLLSFARRAHLACQALEITGLPESELAGKSTVELLVMLDKRRGQMTDNDINRLRYWS